MGIKKLKKENDYLNMTLVEMLGKFDTSKTKKYTQFLVKMINKKRESFNNKTEKDYIRNLENNPLDEVIPCSDFDNTMIRHYVCDSLFSYGNMERFVEFCKLMDKGLVNEKDISKYDSWDMLEMQLFEAKNKDMFKKSKKEISIIFEDENYLIFKPLSYMASCSYGYQTKWCTAMVNDASYFYNHSRGVLIYLIDKKENIKFAFYNPVRELYEMDSHENLAFKTYNQEDKQIDTIQTGLPINIIKIILMETDTSLPTTLPNYKLFSEEEKNIFRKYTGYDSVAEETVDELPMPTPIASLIPRLVPRLTRRRAPIVPLHIVFRREEIMEEDVTEEKCIVEDIIEDNTDYDF
jgi:hypothetical protein